MSNDVVLNESDRQRIEMHIMQSLTALGNVKMQVDNATADINELESFCRAKDIVRPEFHSGYKLTLKAFGLIERDLTQ